MENHLKNHNSNGGHHNNTNKNNNNIGDNNKNQNNKKKRKNNRKKTLTNGNNHHNSTANSAKLTTQLLTDSESSKSSSSSSSIETKKLNENSVKLELVNGEKQQVPTTKKTTTTTTNNNKNHETIETTNSSIQSSKKIIENKQLFDNNQALVVNKNNHNNNNSNGGQPQRENNEKFLKKSEESSSNTDEIDEQSQQKKSQQQHIENNNKKSIKFNATTTTTTTTCQLTEASKKNSSTITTTTTLNNNKNNEIDRNSKTKVVGVLVNHNNDTKQEQPKKPLENNGNNDHQRPSSSLVNEEKEVLENGIESSSVVIQPNETQQSEATTTKIIMMTTTATMNGNSAKSSFGSNVMNGGECLCKICGKHVYHMEQIKAVKSVFHKICFRCVECNKQLSVDTYSSHEGIIYCNPHFKQLFQPKAVFIENDSIESEPKRQLQLIVCENQPEELPPDVVRYNSKQEDALDNLNLDLSNIRNRFENSGVGGGFTADNNRTKKFAEKPVTRSESIHKIMQKYQSRVAGDKDLISSSDDDDDNGGENIEQENGHDPNQQKEKLEFSGMSTLKSRWETGSINETNSKFDDRFVESELAQLRKKGKEPLKNLYEKAILEAKSLENLSLNKSNEAIFVDSSVNAGSIKDKFEKLQFETETEEDRNERLKRGIEAEITQISNSDTAVKEARNKFKQIEANMNRDGNNNNQPSIQSLNDGNHFNHNEDIAIDPAQLQERFKYFENLKETQKEVLKDESDSKIDEIPKVDTTKKMLSKFKALEAGQVNGGNVNCNGSRMPKQITPPREMKVSYESEPSVERDPNIIKSSYKSEEIIQVEPEKAKNLKARFENWQPNADRENKKGLEEDSDLVPLVRDSTKNIRAMFESIKDEYKPIDKPKPRINRFVDNKFNSNETCHVCTGRLYPMEKMEFSGVKLHKKCFRCHKCDTPLRLDNFTQRAGKLFCIPHFRQLFMEKGNYDEGFGLEQHKDKWSKSAVKNGKANKITEPKTNGTATPNHHNNEDDIHQIENNKTVGKGVEKNNHHEVVDDHSEFEFVNDLDSIPVEEISEQNTKIFGATAQQPFELENF